MAAILTSPDYYERLGVPRSADAAAIKQAYVALVRRYPPERAPEEFKHIREAYETLADMDLRRQYDSRPDPRVVAFLSQASLAMGAKRYADAERHFKQVLLLAPDRHDVRAELGWSMLRQNRADEAVAQLERVLGTSAQTPTMLGQLGDAYREAKRYDDAERTYRAGAAAAGPEEPYFWLSLSDLFLVQRLDPQKAQDVLRSALSPMAVTSNGGFDLLTRLISHVAGTPAERPLFAMVERRVAAGGSSKYAATSLGMLARELAIEERFPAAHRISEVASRLQPKDPDCDALERITLLLSRNDLDPVERLLWTHISFGPQGWLRPLRPIIEQYCANNQVVKGLRPVTRQPFLKTVAGCGMRLRGRQQEDTPSKSHVATSYLHLFGVPVVPLRRYRVRPTSDGTICFVGHAQRPAAQPAPNARGSFGGRGLLTILVFAGIKACASAGDTGAAPATAPASTSPVARHATGGSRATGLYNLRFGGLAVSASGRDTAQLVIRGTGFGRVSHWSVEIAGPFGGAGSATLSTKGAQVALASVFSPQDTIDLVGEIHGRTLGGTFRYRSGPQRGRHGWWSVVHQDELQPPHIVSGSGDAVASQSDGEVGPAAATGPR